MGTRDRGNGGAASWRSSGTGALLARAEVRQVRHALDSVFGDQFLQIGTWGAPGAYRRHARTRRAAVVDGTPGPGVDVVCSLNDLPIADDCVDAVLLPHTLDVAADPHGILREVDRILRPDGHVVILGFNPLGTWGVRHYLSRRRFPAGLSRMIAEYRVRDWLTLLSFKVGVATYYGFAAPFYRPFRWPLPRAQNGDAASPAAVATRATGWGPALSSLIAACYITVARKDVFALTPIRPALRRHAPRLGGSLVNPTTRNAA